MSVAWLWRSMWAVKPIPVRAAMRPISWCTAASGSKPEHETKVADAAVVDEILSALGLEHLVAFEKHCANYRFAARGRDMLATVVTVPEIDGTFVELETLAEEADLAAALGDVRAVLGELGIGEDDLTTEQYTDAVMRART